MENNFKTKGETNKALSLLVGLFFIFTLFSFNLINAEKIIDNSNQLDGLSIEPVIKDTRTFGKDQHFEVHVFNKSNGYPITSGITCYWHLYNGDGEHVYIGEDSTPSNIFDYDVIVSSGNFSNDKMYGMKTQCNGTSVIGGGFIEDNFLITSTGIKGIPIEWVLVISILFSIGLILLGFKLDDLAPFGMASFLLLVISLYIWQNGFGALGTKNLISQLIGAGCFLIGAYVGTKTVLDYAR